MSAVRIAAGIMFVAIAAVTACSDGGPPGSWGRAHSHPAPETAADGGTLGPSSEQGTAADGDDTTRTDRRDAATGDAADADAGEDRKAEGSMTTPMAAGRSERDAEATNDVMARAKQQLCDGSPGITFSALAIGGGQPQPGTQVMAENGYNFLIIEGNCQYW